ncbi:MAG: hypothetical protein ACJ8BW_09915 [Ktedonobacteraceae bacterium]
MARQNTTTLLLDERRESRLREHTEALVNETADVLIREAESAAETLVRPRRDQRQPKTTYPAWPTSTPGPQATSPLPGMKPVPTRTDQMVYECYDQERGVPCTAVPARLSIRRHPLADQVKAGQHVYDAQGKRVGKILVCFPRSLLVERGLIFRRSYYIPLWLVHRVEGQRVWLAVREATLAERGYANVPSELYHVPRPSGGTAFADISDASWLGKSPPTPAETGHYHYGPLGPGINTDASGSYAPYEIDPYGRLRDRPVKLYITGKKVRPRTL